MSNRKVSICLNEMEKYEQRLKKAKELAKGYVTYMY